MIPPKRAGFTVVEIIVALAIMSIAMATVVMTTKGRLADSEAEALVSTLEAYRVGIVNYRAHVGVWPQVARQLAYPPDAVANPNINDDTICGGSVSATHILDWRGPYLAQLVAVQGLQVGNSTVQNLFSRNPATSSIAGDLIITVNNVDDDVWAIVDGSIDGKPSSSAGGTVRYTTGTKVLTYRMRIGRC